MRKVFLSTAGFVALLGLMIFAASASGQAPCPQCGQIHGARYASATTGGAETVVRLLNRQRAVRGLYPLIADPQLQSVANRRAVLVARSGRFRGHPAGSFAPARMEGVGMSSGSNPTAVVACETYTQRVRYVGAAMVRRNGRSFFAVLYR